MAYATDESGSDAKIGSARNFESSVSSSSWLAIGRPTTMRFMPLPSGGAPWPGGACVVCDIAHATVAPRPPPEAPFGAILRRP